MARTRDIRTNQLDTACDVCGRTLLRGEHAEHFLAGGERRRVCDLCTARAQHEGWIRESGADEVELEEPVKPLPVEPRHIRAVPTNAELKMQRALDVFNASDHTRTVGG